MIEIEMSKDIKTHTVKVMGPFSVRQIVCLAIACAYGVPLFFILPIATGPKILIVMVLMAPVIACGWVRPFGIPLEVFAAKAFKSWLSPVKRKYQTKNRYEYLLDMEYNQDVPSVTNRMQEEAFK